MRCTRKSVAPCSALPTGIGCRVLFLLLAAPVGAQQMPGYTPADAANERTLEQSVIPRPNPAVADTISRTLSREPHMAGSPQQAATRDYVISRLKSYGIETAVRAYDVYMPYPKSVRVWRASPDPVELRLVEGPVPGDSTSSAFPQIPVFNGYGAAGDVTGEVVYANYGLIEDYAHLDSIGVSVAGKVVVARYGHSFRGIKAREAEKHGAVALLIYSDPADDGFTRGDVFPAGPMRPAQGVQRGSVMNDNGDPSTPGYPSLPGAKRLAVSQMAIPHIPVVPISYGNAAELLSGVHDRGAPCAAASTTPCLAHDPALPTSWQGGLPFRYHVGPGPVTARVAIAVDTGAAAYKTIWDTFGTIRGTTYPDEIVIIGGHRDAWGPGTSDNVSGTTTVLEAARAIAAEAKAGHRPKRTIVFASWDAEEWGLIGSTEYVEDDSLRLQHGAVMYINLDVSAGGSSFGATGSPSLRETLRSVLREVPSPSPDSGTVYDGWRRTAAARSPAASDTAQPTFGDPGGGSDFAGFYNHLGIPIMDWGFGGPTGVYHSAYDDYYWMTRFGDPGYVHHATAARIASVMLLRLANADVLPYDYVEYATTMRGDVSSLSRVETAKGINVSLDPINTSIDTFERSARAFNSARDSALGLPHHEAAYAKANLALLRVERSLTRPEGLKTRPWFRNLIFAADEDNGYANVLFPSVTEAIRSGDRGLVEREVADLAGRFTAAAHALDDATAALR
jgi:N-acetylated-alpha-linked acidic dipeptidase